jgi:hypothetical protein
VVFVERTLSSQSLGWRDLPTGRQPNFSAVFSWLPRTTHFREQRFMVAPLIDPAGRFRNTALLLS